jgi:hypothetical protein
VVADGVPEPEAEVLSEGLEDADVLGGGAGEEVVGGGAGEEVVGGGAGEEVVGGGAGEEVVGGGADWWPGAGEPGVPGPGDTGADVILAGIVGSTPWVFRMPTGVTCGPPLFPDGAWAAAGALAAGAGCADGTVAGVKAEFAVVDG